ncbi:MAG: DUF4384 domain-containing protein [Bryobacteraceae bacterium]
MSRIPGMALWCGVLISAAAQQSSPPALTARELFYKTEPPAPAKPAAKPGAKSAAKTQVAQHTVPSTPNKPPSQSASAAQPLAGGAQFVRVSSVGDPPAPRLGLRYTILRKEGDDMLEVAPDAVFHAGDRIQFHVQVNGPGYLYIIVQGSSGAWTPLFPSPQINRGDNRVDSWETYTMPPGYRMVFDTQTGTEKVFLMFSRHQEQDLEQLIYSLRGGLKPASETPAPSPKDEAPPQRQIVASLSIDDATVGRLRNAYARDLVLEKIDESGSGDANAGPKEKSVYVVNPSGAADSRVVADILLVHQ